TEMEKPVQVVIKEARQRVLDDLENKECKDLFSKQVAHRFDELEEKASSCNNVATLQNIKVEADALKVRFLNEISKEEARLIAGKEPVKPADDGKGGEHEPPKSKVKTYKTVSIKTINTEATWRIETEADVDRYVETLKDRLKQQIKDDVILNVEF
ncbi:MAG: BREX system P-loop protein BrxC, partial [Eubacteriales bacterium]|nr:BREX system P-loop protein BrxC [Eubacteriales bacterium]